MTRTDLPRHAAASDEERRALDADELRLADKARHPSLGQLADRELSDLVGQLRTRRDRARDIADRQGREVRGKSDPTGVSPARGNTGTLIKHDFLNAALDRAMTERQSRRDALVESPEGDDDTPASQHDLAVKAMETKRANATEPSEMTEDGAPLHPHDPDAGKGKAGLANTARHTAPSGALDHAGELPSRERSRTRY